MTNAERERPRANRDLPIHSVEGLRNNLLETMPSSRPLAGNTTRRLLRRPDKSGLLAMTHGAGSGVIAPSPSGEG